MPLHIHFPNTVSEVFTSYYVQRHSIMSPIYFSSSVGIHKHGPCPVLHILRSRRRRRQRLSFDQIPPFKHTILLSMPATCRTLLAHVSRALLIPVLRSYARAPNLPTTESTSRSELFAVCPKRSSHERTAFAFSIRRRRTATTSNRVTVFLPMPPIPPLMPYRSGGSRGKEMRASWSVASGSEPQPPPTRSATAAGGWHLPLHLRSSPGGGAFGSLVRFATITANAAKGETDCSTAAPRGSSRGSAPFPPHLPEASWKAVMQEALRRRRAIPLFNCPSLPAGGVGVAPLGVPSLAA